MTLLVAAAVSVGVALCYAELGTRVPSAGGEYAMIGAMLGRTASWLVFVLTVALTVIIPPVIALGTADYLAPVVGIDRGLAAGAVMVLATLTAVLDIRSNALVTGVFLGLEVVAAAVVAALGFANRSQPLDVLLHPVAPAGGGAVAPFTSGLLLAGLAVAMFTFNGFGSAVYLSEELRDPRRTVARTVLWSLAAAVAVILVPTVAVVLGAPDLATLATGDFVGYVEAWGGSWVAAFVSLAIVAAILNAVIVMVLQNGRMLHASGRDRAWPAPVNEALLRIHPRWRSPWLATLAVGVPGAVLASLVDIEALIGLTGVVVAVVYVLLAAAALRSRTTRHRSAPAWRMPLWPLPPLAVLAAVGLALREQTGSDLVLTGALVAAGAAYYLLYLRPRSRTHWVLTTPNEDQ